MTTPNHLTISASTPAAHVPEVVQGAAAGGSNPLVPAPMAGPDTPDTASGDSRARADGDLPIMPLGAFRFAEPVYVLRPFEGASMYPSGEPVIWVKSPLEGEAIRHLLAFRCVAGDLRRCDLDFLRGRHVVALYADEADVDFLEEIAAGVEACDIAGENICRLVDSLFCDESLTPEQKQAEFRRYFNFQPGCEQRVVTMKREDSEAVPVDGEPQGDHEAGLVGILLADHPPALAVCRDTGLMPDDFTGPLGNVYGAMMDMHQEGTPVDLHTVTDRLKGETLEALGGWTALNRLVDRVVTAAHAGYHARQIVDAATKRRLAAHATDWEKHARDDTPSGELIASIREVLDHEERRTGHAGDLIGISLAALASSEIDQSNTLLGVEGVRYLCRGGTMLFVGPSGVGKSTASAQQDILWALGRPAFGIAPARPLKIVTIQAENDQGDLIHMARGIMAALDLGAEERATVEAGTVYISHNASTGADFLTFVDRVVRRHRPDLIRIDPLMAYAGGDLTKPETIANFCRNGLNRIATGRGIGIVVCHHTPKMTGNTANVQARKQWGAFDWQYVAAGGADLANWARAVLVIESLSRDVFAFRAAKRWPGWTTEDSTPEHVRYFQREREHGKVFWHDATSGDAIEAQGTTARGNGPDLEALRETAAALVKCPISPSVLKDRIRAKMGLTKTQSENLLSLLVMAPNDGGLLVRWEPPTFPRRALVGTPEQHKAWQSPDLASCRPAVILQDDKEHSATVLSSHPTTVGGKTGQQDNGKAGHRTRATGRGVG